MASAQSIDAIVDLFQKNVKSVDKLINFDREVLNIAIGHIKDLSDKLKDIQKISNDQLNGTRTLVLLRGIRDNNSLQSRYRQIFNQAVVLLVSYFGSVVTDIFRFCVKNALRNGSAPKLLQEEVKLSLNDLKNIADAFEERVPDVIISKKDISFQDMQSIARVFQIYFSCELHQDSIVNDIIVGQACRHVIVHSAGVVDGKLINQISRANPRSLKCDISLNEQIQFNTDDIKILSESMMEYLSRLLEQLKKGSKQA